MKKVLLWAVIIVFGIALLSCGATQESQSEDASKETFDFNEMMDTMDDAIDAGESIADDAETITFDDVVSEETQTVPEKEAEKESVEEVHQHRFSSATCTMPQTCADCGATEGEANGHQWRSADCTTPKSCADCGVTEGSAKGHNYSEGSCASCGAKDPSYVSEAMVWIPTNGGKKYHSKSSCSQMKNPEFLLILYGIIKSIIT